MPTFILNSNIPKPEPEIIEKIQQGCATILSEQIGKSQDFVMTALNFEQDLSFGNSSEPCAYAEVKNVGTLNPNLTNSMSRELCRHIFSILNISEDKIYIEFQESERHLWGWNGKTFHQS